MFQRLCHSSAATGDVGVSFLAVIIILDLSVGSSRTCGASSFFLVQVHLSTLTIELFVGRCDFFVGAILMGA
jgi:hypothetical protein